MQTDHWKLFPPFHFLSAVSCISAFIPPSKTLNQGRRTLNFVFLYSWTQLAAPKNVTVNSAALFSTPVRARGPVTAWLLQCESSELLCKPQFIVGV